MKRLFVTVAVLVAAAASSSAVGAATAPATCTAGLVISTTSPGDVSVDGTTTHFRDSGVGGSYTSGFLAGYTLTGAQDIERNDAIRRGVLDGNFTASGAGGTLDVHYTGSVDLTTGVATGHFTTVGGTGQFSDFHWTGDVGAQLVSLTPPTFVATDSGFCHTGS